MLSLYDLASTYGFEIKLLIVVHNETANRAFANNIVPILKGIVVRIVVIGYVFH